VYLIGGVYCWSLNYVSPWIWLCSWMFHRPVYPDDGGTKLLWKINQCLPDYTEQHPRRQPFSYSSPWEPQISPLFLSRYPTVYVIHGLSVFPIINAVSISLRIGGFEFHRMHSCEWYKNCSVIVPLTFLPGHCTKLDTWQQHEDRSPSFLS
jgi:hypothetical protein